MHFIAHLRDVRLTADRELQFGCHVALAHVITRRLGTSHHFVFPFTLSSTPSEEHGYRRFVQARNKCECFFCVMPGQLSAVTVWHTYYSHGCNITMHKDIHVYHMDARQSEVQYKFN